MRWWARLLFQPRQHSTIERRLGLVVVGLALLGAWLIFWTFIPRLMADLALGIVTLLSWIGGLFGGGSPTDAVPATATPGPALGPSPSPSPSPSPFPR